MLKHWCSVPNYSVRMNEKFIRTGVDCRKNYSTIVRKCANIWNYEADAPASSDSTLTTCATSCPSRGTGPAVRGAIQQRSRSSCSHRACKANRLRVSPILVLSALPIARLPLCAHAFATVSRAHPDSGRWQARGIRSPSELDLLQHTVRRDGAWRNVIRSRERFLGMSGNSNRHYYQVVRACGITRVDGITSHGLRHQYSNERYQELTGVDSPVRGGGGVERPWTRQRVTLWPRSWGTAGRV